MAEMRVVHVTAFIGGGAGRATVHLHESLMELGVDSHVFTFDRRSRLVPTYHSPSGLLGRFVSRYMMNIDKLPNKFYRSERVQWSNNWAPNMTLREVIGLKPDVVHLHGIGAGVLPIKDFPHLRIPLVWTLHDMIAFTGGCHYSGDCLRYRDACGSCPGLCSNSASDLSHRNWERKRISWKDLKMTLVCPSNWIASQSRQSSLMANTEAVVIHNGIDLQCFRPRERKSARVALDLPTDKFIVSFGAASLGDSRKGLQLLHQALEIFAARVGREHCELVVFGSGAWEGPPLSIPMRSFGTITDDHRLALIYAASDVFCAPSREENLATTAIEALACGTPVVSFRIGGFVDIVDHLRSGFLANPFEVEDLADGLNYVYSSGSGGQDLRAAARARAERLFDGKTIAARHVELYGSLV